MFQCIDCYLQQALQDTLIKLGELDTSLEDVNGYLQQVEDELSELDHVHGDPKYLETHVKKLKVRCYQILHSINLYNT